MQRRGAGGQDGEGMRRGGGILRTIPRSSHMSIECRVSGGGELAPPASCKNAEGGVGRGGKIAALAFS